MKTMSLCSAAAAKAFLSNGRTLMILARRLYALILLPYLNETVDKTRTKIPRDSICRLAERTRFWLLPSLPCAEPEGLRLCRSSPYREFQAGIIMEVDG